MEVKVESEMGGSDDEALMVPAVTPPQTRSPRSDWRILMAGAAFVIAVAGVFSFVMSENPKVEEPVIYSPAFAGGFTDNFERPKSTNDPGEIWVSVRGTWGVQVGVAYLSKADPELNVMVVDVGSSTASVSALVGGKGVCGVVARYKDEKNYLALVRVAGYGVWNVVSVVGGVSTVIGVVGDGTEDTLGARLDVGDDVLVATVGIRQVMFTVKIPVEGSSVGLIATLGGDQCAWDNVVAGVAR